MGRRRHACRRASGREEALKHGTAVVDRHRSGRSGGFRGKQVRNAKGRRVRSAAIRSGSEGGRTDDIDVTSWFSFLN